MKEEEEVSQPWPPAGTVTYLGLGEALAGARDELGEVGVHELEDEVDAAVHPGGGDALEADDVGVVEALQDPDLPRHEPHAL